MPEMVRDKGFVIARASPAARSREQSPLFKNYTLKSYEFGNASSSIPARLSPLKGNKGMQREEVRTPPIAENIFINELMPYPLGSDAEMEWIEVVNEDNVALTPPAKKSSMLQNSAGTHSAATTPVRTAASTHIAAFNAASINKIAGTQNQNILTVLFASFLALTLAAFTFLLKKCLAKQ